MPFEVGTASPMRHYVCKLLLLLILSAAIPALVGCNDQEIETPTLLSTGVPVTTATPADGPESDALSLEEYLAFCQEFHGYPYSDENPYNNGEMSVFVAKRLSKIERISPPAEVSEWHNQLAYFNQSAVTIFGKLPEDDFVNFGTRLLILKTFEAVMEEVTANLPRDVALQMAGAGCIYRRDVPDDHGYTSDDATVIRIGEAAGGTIDYRGDSDYFRFNVQGGQLYRIEAALGTLDAARITLRTVNIGYGDWLGNNDDPQAPVIRWGAKEPGDFTVEVIGAAGAESGSYTLTVFLAVDDHADDTNSATTISPGVNVDGAIDYRGDSDYFQFTAEAGHRYRIDMTYSFPGPVADVFVFDSETMPWTFRRSVAGFDSNFPDDDGDTWNADRFREFYIEVNGEPKRYTLAIVELTDD